GRTLWQIAQMRWQRHFHAWRDMGFQTQPAVLAAPSFAKLRTATQEFVCELSQSMAKIAQPRKYRVVLERSRTLPLKSLSFSPAYPYRAEEFSKAFPPELTPNDIAWTAAPFDGFAIDLGKHFKGAVNCVSYGRLALNAEQACSARLTMGS